MHTSADTLSSAHWRHHQPAKPLPSSLHPEPPHPLAKHGQQIVKHCSARTRRTPWRQKVGQILKTARHKRARESAGGAAAAATASEAVRPRTTLPIGAEAAEAGKLGPKQPIETHALVAVAAVAAVAATVAAAAAPTAGGARGGGGYIHCSPSRRSGGACGAWRSGRGRCRAATAAVAVGRELSVGRPRRRRPTGPAGGRGGRSL